MIELDNFKAKTIHKKDYSKELIAAVAGYIKQRNYIREATIFFFLKKLCLMKKRIIFLIMSVIYMTLTYELNDIKKKLVKFKGEKLDET